MSHRDHLDALPAPKPDVPQLLGGHSAFAASMSQPPVDVTPDRLDRILCDGPTRGTLNLPVGEVLELADAKIAHRMLDGAPHKPGKIVLKVAD